MRFYCFAKGKGAPYPFQIFMGTLDPGGQRVPLDLEDKSFALFSGSGTFKLLQICQACTVSTKQPLLIQNSKMTHPFTTVHKRNRPQLVPTSGLCYFDHNLLFYCLSVKKRENLVIGCQFANLF